MNSYDFTPVQKCYFRKSEIHNKIMCANENKNVCDPRKRKVNVNFNTCTCCSYINYEYMYLYILYVLYS